MKKIFIIDDDTETLDLLRMILNKKFSVTTISDPACLQEELHNQKPDLIIIDHFIGCTTSKEIIAAFKNQEAYKNIPVIIHSGHEHIEQIARSANANGYIKKPSGINDIRSYIDHQLECVNEEAILSSIG